MPVLRGGKHVRTRNTGTPDHPRDRGPPIRGGEASADRKRPWGRDPQLQKVDEGEERNRRHSHEAGEQGQIADDNLPAGPPPPVLTPRLGFPGGIPRPRRGERKTPTQTAPIPPPRRQS